MFHVHVLEGKSGKKSLLVPLDDLFPGCKKLTAGTNLPRLSCWTNPGSCHKGTFTACMRIAIGECYKLFQGMPDLELVIMYWKSPEPKAPSGMRSWGLIVEKDEDKELRISTLNKWALEAIENKIGKKYAVSFD